MDFFLYFLATGPAELLGKQDGEHSGKATAIQSRLVKMDADIAAAMELIGAVPIAELKTKLAAMEAKRQQAKAELDALNHSMLSVSTPQAFMDIRAVFARLRSHPVIKLERGPSGYFEGPDMDEVWATHWDEIDEASAKLDKYKESIAKTLKDNSIRKRLLQLLPSIVSHLVINLEKNAYAVVFHNGKRSEWRKVAV